MLYRPAFYYQNEFLVPSAIAFCHIKLYNLFIGNFQSQRREVFMTQGSASPKTGRKSILPCILIPAIGLIGLIIIGGVGLLLISQTIKPVNQSFLTRISAPSTGFTALSGQPIDIQASSLYHRGVTRLDVFADGGLIASQASTLTGGSNPLVLLDRWVPQSPGRHVLMARARSKDGKQSDSAVVFIDVSQEVYRTAIEISDIHTESGNPPTLNEIAASTGISLGELLDANPDLEGTDPDEPLDPDTELFLPPGETEGGGGEAPPSGAPASPENLAITMTCTQATLSWNDVSTDEDHYVIYRLDPGSSSMNQTGPLLPPDTEDFIDNLPGLGTFNYQVGVRAGGEESFSMVVAASTPPGCAPPPPGSTDLMLTVRVVETDNVFNTVFCYVTLTSAGAPWDRIPDGDFTGLPPSAPHQYRLDSLPNRGRYLLSFHNPANPVEFDTVCLGRNPPFADYIGAVHLSHPPADWDGSARHIASLDGTAGNYTLYYCLGPVATPCDVPGLPPLPPSPWVTDPYLPPPTNLRLEQSTETCLDLPTEPERIFCIIIGGMTGGYPTLLWDWNGDPYYQDSDLTGYHVILQSMPRATHNVTVIGEWDVLRRLDGTLGKAISDHADHSVCGITYSYIVSAAAGDRHSIESIPLEIDTPDCFEPIRLTVDIHRLQIPGPINDCGDWPGGEANMEVYGTFRLHAGIFTDLVNLMPATSVVAGVDTTASALWGLDTHLDMPIFSDSATADINVRLSDHDVLFPCPADPTFCNIHLELPARSTAEWLALHTTEELTSSNGEAGCTVTLSLDGNPIP
jgi:hypothetical protein